MNIFYIFLFLLSFVQGLEHTHRRGSLVKRAVCYDTDQVPLNIFFGYNRADKTDSNKNMALNIFNVFRGFLAGEGGESFYNSNGNVYGFMWVGSMVHNRGFKDNILPIMENEVKNYGIPKTLYLEYDGGGDPMKSFGIILDTTSRDTVVKAAKLWSQGKKLNSYEGSKNYQATACYLSYAYRKPIVNDNFVGTCDYFTLESGKTPADQSGINGESLQGYNPNLDFSKLSAGQPICKTIGNPPNFKPSKNSDGSCKTYKVSSGESCSSIAVKYYPLSLNDIENYNKGNYGWKGCSSLQKDYNLCVSDGSAPRPVSNPIAECGPLAPGEKYNAKCPLNACCSEFGFCGLTKDYCDKKSSTTGAPGTDGCFSNCGYGSTSNVKSSTFKKIAYWLDAKDKLAMDPKNIPNGPYDILHYAFVNINSDFSIDDSAFSKSAFLKVTSSKKIPSFGGWDFSTSPSTYTIFRNAVKTDQNRNTFANNLINFMNKYNLDGIDLDWEYPGAPDIPDIPADDSSSGSNYLTFLKLLKGKMPSGKTLSIAIPSSYWYLKNFPISDIQNTVDYMVYMTYDIHGIWEYGKANSYINCHTPRKEIEDAIKMLDKAGVKFNKVFGGVANYGRSYKMVNTNCYNYGCGFQREGGNSRDMTNTPGVLSDSEIIDIDSSDKKNDRWVDTNTDCIFMKYDENSVVSWPKSRYDLEDMFKNYGFAGTSLWAANYFKHDEWKNDEDDNNDDTEDPFDEENVYFDVYDCKNKAGYDLDNPVYGCRLETAINIIIWNGTESVNTVLNILNDYDNYIKYYEALTRAHYDSVMEKYEKWLFEEDGYYTYYTDVDGDDIIITPPDKKKRDYIQEKYSFEKEFMMSQNMTELTEIKVNKTINFMLNGTSLAVKEYNNEKVLYKRGDIPPPGSNNRLIRNSIILDKDKEAAIASFKQYSGIELSKDSFVQRDKDKKFDLNGKHYTFMHSTILNAIVLFPNVLTNIDSDYIHHISDLIEQAHNSLGNESPDNIYEVLESVVVFMSVSEIADYTYTEGKKIKEKYDKMKKTMIVGIILGIIGGLSLFLGPIGIATSVLADFALLGADAAINGELNPSDLAFALAGLFLPVFASLGKTFKFAEALQKININKSKNFDNLNEFEKIRFFRSKLGKVKMCGS
jgi:GH18 family chitinase